MSWLGFSFSKRPSGSSTSSSSTHSNRASHKPTPPTDTLAHEQDEFAIGTDEAPTIRMLKPEEIEKLQNENEQLKQLILELSEKRKEHANKNGNTVTYPNLSALPSAPSAPSSSSSSSSSEYTFQKISTQSLFSPSAPPLDPTAPSPAATLSRRPSLASTLTPEQMAPVEDFYESLRKSLAITSKPAPTTASATSATKATSSNTTAAGVMADDDDDDWSDSVCPKAPPIVDSVHAPRTEDEAIVHNKHGSVVIHKKPLRPILDDDTGPKPTLSTKKPVADGFDDFEDEFGMETETPSVAHAPMATDEPEEEVAIFDVSQADWWYVVPHPDRVNEELVAAPQTPLDPAEDEDGFVLIKSNDSLTALGEFISHMMAKHPDVARLSPEQVRSMIEQSLVDRGITEPSATGKLWRWGSQAYSIWSWSSTFYGFYKDQTAIRMVAAGVIKAATWSCVFLL